MFKSNRLKHSLYWLVINIIFVTSFLVWIPAKSIAAPADTMSQYAIKTADTNKNNKYNKDNKDNEDNKNNKDNKGKDNKDNNTHGTNLTLNPGFENLDSNGLPADWIVRPEVASYVSIDSSTVYSEDHSLKLETKPNSFTYAKGNSIPVKPNTKYYISWWCRTDLKESRAYLWLDTNIAQRVFSKDEDQMHTREWTLYMAEYITTSDETWISPVPTTQSFSDVSGFAWFDDIGVYEGTFPPALAELWKKKLNESRNNLSSAIVLTQSPELTVWAGTLEAKIYKEDGLPTNATPTDKVNISAAKGEENFFQVAIIPNRDLTGVTIQPESLTGSGTIPASSIRYWPVGYVNVKNTLYSTTRMGLTPDPLLEAQPISAAKGQNTPFCIGISVPTDAAAGIYNGNIKLKAGGSTLFEVPISLKVYNFSLPENPTLKTILQFQTNRIYNWHENNNPSLSESKEDIKHDIFNLLNEHGTRGDGTLATVDAKIVNNQVVCDFTSFDRHMEWLFKNYDVNAFFLGPFFGGGTGDGWLPNKLFGEIEVFSPEFNNYFPEYMRQVAQHLREKGWFDKAYLYLIDEPQPSYFDKVVSLQKLALQGDPDFKIFETTSTEYSEFQETVKAWSVPLLKTSFDEYSVNERKQAGDEIWFYNIPSSLEASLQAHRLWFWQASCYGATGAQLWHVAWYNDIDPWVEITPKPWINTFGEQVYKYQAGEGIMVYPNPNNSGSSVLSSLRLREVQKGINDYEYLNILKAKNPAKAKELTQKLVKDVNVYSINTLSDADIFEQVRDEVAKAIESSL